jgi:hypothetical protein
VVAQTPRFANNALRVIGTGWRLAGLHRANSGGYLSVTSATDRQLSGQSNQRLNQILPDHLCADPRPSCWINPAAFAIPALETLGNMGPANIPGPKCFQLDLALSREFRIHKQQLLEIRGEVFNVTNSFRAGGLTNFQPNGLSGVTTVQSNKR